MLTLQDFPKKVRVVDVGPRDGLQNEKTIVPVEERVRLVEALLDAGLREVEAGAFVSPRWVPQMNSSGEVFRQVKAPAGASLYGLVPNRQGLEAAREAGCVSAAVFTAASESFTRKNINATIEESFARFRDLLPVVQAHGMSLRGYVSTSFFCPYEGRIAPEKVTDVAARLLEELGVFEVSIGDTLGAATPSDISRLLDVMLKRIPKEKIALHLHDTRGTALANVLAGLAYGISAYDTSAGGLGGCPYAPSATGNLSTEDLVYMLNGLGIETGISLEKVAYASRRIGEVLGRSLPSRVANTSLKDPATGTGACA
jgi:isopropylmalate/homocitrate/citramalate synthase